MVLQGKHYIQKSNHFMTEFHTCFFRPRSVYRPLNPLAPSRGGCFIHFHAFRDYLQNVFVTKQILSEFSTILCFS